MGTAGVVGFVGFANVFSGIGDTGVLASIDLLVFEGTPETFNEDVVQSAPTAVHADPDVMTFQYPYPIVSRELAALVGAHDFGRVIQRAGPLERLHEVARVHAVGQFPDEDFAPVPVHDRNKVDETAVETDVGDIRAPSLVRPFNGQVPHQVRVDFVPRGRLGQVWLRAQRLQAHQPHQSAHFASPDVPPHKPQDTPHLPGSEKRELRVDLVGSTHQFQLLRVRANRLVIRARARRLRQFTMAPHRYLGLLVSHGTLCFRGEYRAVQIYS